MIELKQDPDNTSVSISYGSMSSFTISFCEVPRAQDNAERSYQRVHDPYGGGGREGCLQPVFPFTIYNSPALKDSRALAIKDDKAFAIRMSGTTSSESAFKAKVSVGGVNVIQHTTTDGKDTLPQDYFVVSEQEWIWGTQVGKDTARQFRVFGRHRERLSLRSQLRKNNLVKEVEIQITSRRQTPPTCEADTTSESSTLAGSSDEPSDPQQFFVPFASSSSSNQRPPTEKASPHEMVIGTGGLIRQVIAKDKHPEDWTDDTITLKFKILNPQKPKHFQKVTGLRLGNPGGNWNEKPNPAKKFFRRRAPVVEDTEGMREDIRSPEEIEADEDVDMDSDLDSGVAMGRASEMEEEDEEVSPEERNRFAALMGEARSQPRELETTNGNRKEKKKKNNEGKREKKDGERRPGVMHIMVLNQRAGPVNNAHGRRSTWRKFLEAMRRVLTPGQWVA